MKLLTMGGKRMKLTIWDTAGQERFGTLISSYYRGAHGIILVYDVTRRETFTNLSDVWTREVDLYSTNQDCVKILVGNKVDRDSERTVTREEGMALAQKHKCFFFECSAKTRENVQQCFKEAIVKPNQMKFWELCHVEQSAFHQSNINSNGDQKPINVNWDNIEFGLIPTDYMYVMKCSKGESFSQGSGCLKSYGNVELSPSSRISNYGQDAVGF